MRQMLYLNKTDKDAQYDIILIKWYETRDSIEVFGRIKGDIDFFLHYFFCSSFQKYNWTSDFAPLSHLMSNRFGEDVVEINKNLIINKNSV